MQKKGQITVFIILGIILLFLTAGILFIVQKITKDSVTSEREEMAEGYRAESIKSFIEHCLERTANEAMVLVSSQGGYYKVPEPALDQVFVKVPYYFYFGKKQFPEKATIEREIENYLVDQLPICLNDFKVFSKQGLKIEQREMQANVTLNEKSSVELTLPITLQIGDSAIELNKFSYLLNVNFEQVYQILSETMAEHELNPDYVPIGHLSSSAQESGFNFELNYLKDKAVVYSFIFDQYPVDEEDYVFIFASKYTWSELLPEDELDYAQEIKDQECYVGDTCFYNLNIYNDEFTFEDFTGLFDISVEGKIEFIPQHKDVGKHNVLIKVSDLKGREKYLSFGLEILTFNNPPELGEIKDQLAYVNTLFTYQINATDLDGDDITYFKDTDLFDISPEGLISFTPEQNSTGFHIIEITVSDGEFEEKGWMYLTIENE